MTTILVVDDSPMDRRVAGGFLTEAGFTPVFAKSGTEALDLIAVEPPDLVLTDMRMPGMDGLELVETLREQYPSLPVILMTGYGSEETAVQALQAGAASYVPKTKLKHNLLRSVEVVLDAAAAALQRQQGLQYLKSQVSTYVLDYDRSGPRALVSHLQEDLRELGICQEADLIRVGTALTEALANAMDHGNLELDSSLRETSEGEYRRLGEERATTPPYRDRRVRVTAHLTPSQATFTVRDEGRGFDHRDLPDPCDPENLTKASGRGVLLIRTFMDEVQFNERGNEITMVIKVSEDAA